MLAGVGLFVIAYLADKRSSKHERLNSEWGGVVEEVEERKLVAAETGTEYVQTVLHYRKDNGARYILRLDRIDDRERSSELGSLTAGARLFKKLGEEYPCGPVIEVES